MRRPDDPAIRARLLVWWTIWGSMLVSLLMVYLLLGRGPLPASELSGVSLYHLLGMVPLFLGIVIRWLVLPRIRDFSRAFVVFIVGIALGTGAGFLGIFFGGPYRDTLFFLGMLGIAQFVPFFARALLIPTAERFKMR